MFKRLRDRAGARGRKEAEKKGLSEGLCVSVF